MSSPLNASSPSPTSAQAIPGAWEGLIPDDQWEILSAGTAAIAQAGVPFLLGGAMALAAFTGHWRNTKDVDVIIRPRDREAAIAAVRAIGFEDYFERQAYDRSWLFRAFRNGVLFDIIWELPNHRVEIDDSWFERAPSLRLRERVFATAPAEELVRVKLYVMQRERCDWVDVLNVLACTADRLDWQWLVRRMDRDLPLLQAALVLFAWMCPGRTKGIPEWVRTQFALPEIQTDTADEMEHRRVRLFDSRPWFYPHQPSDRPLER